MKPYYQDEWVTIYHGDCREILPELPKVDLVLTDPPYGVNYKDADWDTEPFDSIIEWLMPEIMTILNDGCHTFIWSPVDSLMNKHFTGIFVAGKNWGQYRANMHWMDCWSPILVATNGKPRRNIRGGKNFFESNTAVTARYNAGNYRRFAHETPKSEDVSSYIIDCYSLSGELILDPFLGSGTTCYCAKKLNRKSIGIEIEDKYCEIAARRCSQGVFNLSI